MLQRAPLVFVTLTACHFASGPAFAQVQATSTSRSTLRPDGETLAASETTGRLRDFSPPAEYLLGLCYTLAHRPQEARGQEFGRQARRWLEDMTAAYAAGRRREPEGVSPTDVTKLSGLAAVEDRPAASRVEPAVRDPITAAPVGDTVEPVPGAAELRAAGTAGAVQASTALGAGTFTRLGGAIYLVNLMILLGLPESISALARLNPWALLGGLAAGLLGRRFPEYAADPLWAAVEQLGGEETLRPWGASLLPGTSFQVPRAWLELLPPRQLVAYREPAAGRLQVWAAEPGYLLADLPPGTSLGTARAEWPGLVEAAMPPAGIEDLLAGANQLLAPALAWWVQRLQPFAARFLARLTGQGSDAAAALFHQPGTLYTSRTHVDLVLPVEQISIPLRRAGLDRTPGWRPEFGYIITIHFE